MQINVVNIIIDSLLANGKCSIDGLGTFILNKQQPIIDQDEQLITVPKSNITFEDQVHEEIRLEDELLKVYPFSRDKAQKVVSLFANKVVNALINFDQVELSNLGQLKNDKEKSGLQFTSSATLQQIIDASQPDVDLKPFLAAKATAAQQDQQEAQAAKASLAKQEHEDAVQRAKARMEADRIKSTKAQSTQSSLKSPTMEPVTQSTQPVRSHTPPPQTPAQPIVKETVVPKTKVQDTHPVAPQTHKEQPSPDKKITAAKSEMIPPTYEDDEGFFSKYLPWILLALLLAALTWGMKKIISAASTESEKTEVTVDDDRSDTDQMSQQIDSDNTNTEDTHTDQGQATSTQQKSESAKRKVIQPSECIIITGSYLDQQNMDEMSSKIRMMGYEVYTEKYGYYTRVGFKFPCDDVNLKLFIQEIRANISKESWYLIPDLSI